MGKEGVAKKQASLQAFVQRMFWPVTLRASSKYGFGVLHVLYGELCISVLVTESSKGNVVIA